MASLKLFVFVLICLLPSAFSFWTQCANGRAPISVVSPQCGTDRCVITRGTQIVMTVTADFVATHETLRPRATAIFFGISIVIPDVPGHDDICPILFENGAYVGCPARPNTVYTWTIDMIVPSTIPSFSNGRMRVDTLDGTQVVNCFEAIGQMI